MRANRLAVSLAVLSILLPAVGAEWRDPASRVTEKVRKELAGLSFYGVFDYLEFQVVGCAVVLDGAVTRPSLKADAERAAGSVVGIDRVVNRIRVLPASRDDEKIRQTVYRSIYYHPTFKNLAIRGIPPVHIVVENGRVCLKGDVPSEMLRDLAAIRANTVAGVFEVENLLRVKR